MRFQSFFGCACGMVIVGCASSQTPDTPEPRATAGVDRTRIETPKGVVVTQAPTSSHVVESTVKASPDLTWNAVADVYSSLGIAVGTLDTRAKVIGNPGMRMRRALGGTRLSTYFDCGTSALGMRNADNYSLSVDLLTQVVAGEDKWTMLRTRVRATAVDEGTSERRVTCTSTGALESRIADMVESRVKSA